MCYAATLRGKWPCLLDLLGTYWESEVCFKTEMKLGEVWRDGMSVELLHAPDLRFWPTVKAFNEVIFMKTLVLMQMCNVPNGGEQWMQAARNWIENGI